MKINYLWLYFALLLIISNAFAWDFPLKPGSPEYADLSLQEKVTVFQIPDDILKTISTEDLIDVCLNYPYMVTIYVYDNQFAQLERVAKCFNGLQELLSRKNATLLIFDKYKSYSNNIDDNWTLIEKGQHGLKESYLGLMVVESILHTEHPIYSETRKEMLKEISKIYYDHFKRNDIYSIINAEATGLLAAHLLMLERNKIFQNKLHNSETAAFVKYGLAHDYTVVSEIIAIADGNAN